MTATPSADPALVITSKSVDQVVEWVTSGYLHFRDAFSDAARCSDRDIYHMLLGHRYDVTPGTQKLPFPFLAAAVVPGLRGLALVVLEEEAGYLDHDDATRRTIVQQVDAALAQTDLPLDVIYGVSLDEELDVLASAALAA